MKFEVEIVDVGRALAFDLPFDPKEAFGKVRAPVRVTINGYDVPDNRGRPCPGGT